MEKIDKIAKHLPNNIYVLIITFITVFIATSYLLINDQAKDTLVEQMLHREQLAARAGAKSLETFFNLYSRSFLGLAVRSDILAMNEKTQESLDSYLSRWNNTPIGGILIADMKGKVLFNANRTHTPDIGGSITQREYFTWAKDAQKGEVFIASPYLGTVGTAKGRYVTAVATPLIDNSGKKVGLMAASVILEDVVGQYINSLDVTNSSLEYFLTEDGDILASNQEGVIAQNLFEGLSKVDFVGHEVLRNTLQKLITSRTEGKLQVAYPISLNNMGITKMLVAYSPVVVGDNHFVLAIATPEKEALAFLFPIYVRGLIILSIAFFVVFLISLRLVKAIGYREGVNEDAQLHEKMGLPKNRE